MYGIGAGGMSVLASPTPFVVVQQSQHMKHAVSAITLPTEGIAHIVMAYVIMAYIVMAYIVTAY